MLCRRWGRRLSLCSSVMVSVIEVKRTREGRTPRWSLLFLRGNKDRWKGRCHLVHSSCFLEHLDCRLYREIGIVRWDSNTSSKH